MLNPRPSRDPRATVPSPAPVLLSAIRSFVSRKSSGSASTSDAAPCSGVDRCGAIDGVAFGREPMLVRRAGSKPEGTDPCLYAFPPWSV